MTVSGVDVVQHQVHNVEGAGAEMGEEGAEAPGSDMEQEEEWEQQAGWGRAAKGGNQVLEDGQEDAPEEVRAEQADESGKAQAHESGFKHSELFQLLLLVGQKIGLGSS